MALFRAAGQSIGKYLLFSCTFPSSSNRAFTFHQVPYSSTNSWHVPSSRLWCSQSSTPVISSSLSLPLLSSLESPTLSSFGDTPVLDSKSSAASSSSFHNQKITFLFHLSFFSYNRLITCYLRVLSISQSSFLERRPRSRCSNGCRRCFRKWSIHQRS